MPRLDFQCQVVLVCCWWLAPATTTPAMIITSAFGIRMSMYKNDRKRSSPFAMSTRWLARGLPYFSTTNFVFLFNSCIEPSDSSDTFRKFRRRYIQHWLGFEILSPFSDHETAFYAQFWMFNPPDNAGIPQSNF